MDKTAVIYARVSTVRQADEELPIESQIEQCKQKAETLGARVVRIFRDDGLSGTKDTRPAFQEAINYCTLFSPQYFITWSSSRFARNRVDAGFYKRELNRVGTDLTYVSMSVDTSTNEGWLVDGVMELFDELYSRQVSADTMRSMIKNAREGYWNGGRPPFGYAPGPDQANPKRRRLQVMGHEADIVRRIFAMRIDGYGAKLIAVELNEQGITNRGKRWTKDSIARLLRNEGVIGCIVFGKEDKSAGRRRPRDQWIVVPAHEPIIDRETWDTVQALMDEGASFQDSSPRSTFMFTGILKCATCGSSMQIETAKGRSRRYEYYNCRRAQRSGGCENRRLSARELDEWLVDTIAREVFTANNLRAVVEELNEACGSWATDHRKRRQAVVSRLQMVERRNRTLYEVLEHHGKDAPNLGDLTKRLRENNSEISALERQLADIDSEQPPSTSVTEADIQELAASLTHIIKTTENPVKARHFFGSFISGIYVEDYEIRIEYKPHVLVQNDAVHSKAQWLPSADSNHGPGG